MYRRPAGEKLAYHYINDEKRLVLHRYWTNACQSCAIKQRCTIGKERRITRWEHEHILEAVQKRLDKNPHAMRQRCETTEHPFGTLKMRMGAAHFLMKRCLAETVNRRSKSSLKPALLMRATRRQSKTQRRAADVTDKRQRSRQRQR